ncbi:MAG: FAD-dependent oxidoreductase, partial [Pseudomonadota bacterium]
MTLNSSDKVVIVGGGQAGAQAAFSLRQWGFEGPIAMVCDEPSPPYQRPPLSKAYLKGEMPEERLYFKPSAWYEDNGVDLILSTRATAIDRAAGVVNIEHGGTVPYERLILATGSRPRPLPVRGAGLEGVFELRNLADV